MGNKCLAAKVGKPMFWNAKQQGQQHKTYTQIAKSDQKKKAKPNSQRNYREIFGLGLSMIEYNQKQVLTIILTCAEAVSWCTQLVRSACEHADTILYSDQCAVTLLISLLS